SDFDQQNVTNDSAPTSSSSFRSSSGSSFGSIRIGAIGKDTIKGFYQVDNIKSKNLEKIGAWMDIIYTTE
ncbi:20706_t:CDS:2, partial [Funneliformis geosporum]